MSNEHADENKKPDAPDRPPTPEELRGIVETITSQYPPPRLGTELVLLEVNPHRAHAYWNIDVEDFQAAQKQTGLTHAPLVLRLYDITDGTPPEKALTGFDVEIQGLQGHWYLDLWKDGRTHVADLGFRATDGRLVKLARSNPVSTPPASESPDYQTLALNTAQPGQPEVTDLLRDPSLAPETQVIDWPTPAGAPAERVHDEVKGHFDREAEASTAAPASGPWQGPSAAPLAPGSTQEPAGWPSSQRLQDLVPASPESAPPPADQPAPPAKAAPSPLPTSLDHYVSLSSFTQGRREVALEVNVELHIYGRAKPGTELTLYGQPVPLGPDGSFSIRKPLPQGAVVLPLLAVDPPASKD